MSVERVETRGPGWLRRDAERISGALPPLLVEAHRLAHTVAAGVHGRRRSGPGETFWQYRQAMPGDPQTAIDWRRSARSDHVYIREMEWESAQTVWIWRDDALSMDYHSDATPRSKAERAALLALAMGVLLTRGGERIGLIGTDAQRPAAGESQLRRMALALARQGGERPDFGAPPAAPFTPGGKVVFLSDFLGPLDGVAAAAKAAAAVGLGGAFMQILDPTEEGFPFDGRMIFESMGGQVSHETQRARGLAETYRGRLAARRDELDALARACGWRMTTHHTDVSPRRGLIWLYGAIGAGGG